MGVHTGDSITVAPAQTLTDKEYQIMRNAAIDIIREIGEGGYAGLNVRFDRLLGKANDAAFTKENQYYAGVYTGVRF